MFAWPVQGPHVMIPVLQRGEAKGGGERRKEENMADVHE